MGPGPSCLGCSGGGGGDGGWISSIASSAFGSSKVSI